MRRLIKSTLDDWFEQLKEKIDEFMQVLSDNVPNVKIRYVKILPCHYWSAYGRKFASRLDGYVLNGIGRRYRVRMLQLTHMYRYCQKLSLCSVVHDYVLPGLPDNKGVHMNAWGTRSS